MSKNILRYLFLLLFIVIYNEASANHVLGGEINYKYLATSGDTQTYKVTLTFIGDCSAVSINLLVGPSSTVDMYKDDQFVKRPVLAYDTAQSNIEITPVCPDEQAMTSCINPNNPIPGIKRYIYSGLVTLVGKSANWRFIFTGDLGTTAAGRSIIIQNANPLNGTSIIRLEATLNNTVYTNSSTYFSSLPAPFFCVNKTQTYNLGAIDEDNDKLVFSLVPAQVADQGTASHSISYIAPYTYDRPLPTAAPDFNFNPNTGQIDFLPDQTRNCLVVNLVEEYRNNVKVGSCMREMIFVIVNNCNNDVPQEVIENVQNTLFTNDPANPVFTICEGKTTPLSFEIKASDPNGDNITISHSNIPPGAVVSITGNGTPSPVLYFSWDASNAALGDYLFHITYADDGCTLESRKTLSYIVRVVPYDGTFITGYSGPCLGQSNGLAWIVPESTPEQYRYVWTDSLGNVLRDVYSGNGDTLKGLPLGRYNVLTITGQGCRKNTEVDITEITELPDLPLPVGDTVLCNDVAYKIVTPVQSFVDYSWNTGETGCCITISQPGLYIRKATNHCGTDKDSISVQYVKCNFCFFIPNAFSPNGDGKNDLFRINETCNIEKFKFQVFNRWGQLIFSTLSTANGWDGSYRGQPAETGTYFYLIEATPLDKSKGNTLQLKGDFLLVR